MNIILKTFCLILLSLSTANADVFKAGIDDDPSWNRERYGHGSLIKDKGSFLNNMFNKNSSDNCEAKDKLKIKKETKDTESLFRKTWNAILEVISDIPLENLDIKSGKIETQLVNIESFDTTGVCQYKLIFNVNPNGKFSVDIISAEDSKARIEKLKKIIIEKVNNKK